MRRLHVSRHVLFVIAGILWTAVGVLLCVRAIGWAINLGAVPAVGLESSGFLIALVAYRAGFRRITERNIERISGLAETVPVHAFTGPRGYVMIGVMITAGVLLRGSVFPKMYLVLPYTAMGGVLIRGSVEYYRQFMQTRKPGRL